LKPDTDPDPGSLGFRDFFAATGEIFLPDIFISGKKNALI